MTSSEIRKSFLDFFKSKEHTIVPSASLMPSSPNLLFTNAGMNQFVPYLLGDERNPFLRAADTQKCIRAGGKHNDLEDVGLDTYHHTFFEMLGNWSFGDYFKKEAIEWAWELLTDVWKFPKERLYATVYEPAKGEPSEFDVEAWNCWAKIFSGCKLDPEIHIIKSGKQNNFWMMGDTGPCGPCSEIHIDLTPKGDTCGTLVNADSPMCIELWNLVFMQFNAEPDGSFVPLKTKNIDTGMGLERIAGIFARTRNFTDFNELPSNYDSDLFTDIFSHISSMSDKKYLGTLPRNRKNMSSQELTDCAFRVLADHVRTLVFAISDGIIPGNEGRNYVLRRILRRAVMYGKRLGLKRGFFARLADPVIRKMSPVFPELAEQRDAIIKTMEREENSFAKTIDKGLQLFDCLAATEGRISGEQAFVLYNTHGFPIDLTELMARERNLSVDIDGFETAMRRQRKISREAQRGEIIKVSDVGGVGYSTQFLGYDDKNLTSFKTKIIAVVEDENADFVATSQTPFYAEKGGQVGDSGFMEINGVTSEISDTKIDKAGHILHKTRKGTVGRSDIGASVSLSIDVARRRSIQRHHSATHILHWALRQVLGFHVKQAGSYVDAEKLRFDFSHFEAPTPEQIVKIERLANLKILENAKVVWRELPYAEIPEDCMALFGEKYGAIVRVVEMGDFSRELCGGTHVSNTGEIGVIKIVSESAIAAGKRRIEAVAGVAALERISGMQKMLDDLSGKLSCKTGDLPDRIGKLILSKGELEREVKDLRLTDMDQKAKDIAKRAVIVSGEIPFMVEVVGVRNPAEMRNLAVELLRERSNGVAVLMASFGMKASVVVLCSKAAIDAGFRAGDIVRDISAQLGGKGGGKSDYAQGGGSSEKLSEIASNYVKSMKR